MKAVVVFFVLLQVWQLLLLPLPLYRFGAERISDSSSTIFLTGVRINRPVCSHLRRNLFSCSLSPSSTWAPQHPPAFPASSLMLEDTVRLFVLQLPLCLCWTPFHLFQLLLRSFFLQPQPPSRRRVTEPAEWWFLHQPTLSRSVLRQWMGKVCQFSEGTPIKWPQNIWQITLEICKNMFLFDWNYCLLIMMPTGCRWDWAPSLPIVINIPQWRVCSITLIRPKLREADTMLLITSFHSKVRLSLFKIFGNCSRSVQAVLWAWCCV